MAFKAIQDTKQIFLMHQDSEWKKRIVEDQLELLQICQIILTRDLIYHK
jgi:hypothetical protein